MKLKPYPEYKDSGIEWLGEIPSHWTLRPAITLGDVLTSTVDKKSYPEDQPVLLCNYTDVYYNDELSSNEGFMPATATSAQIEGFSVLKNDVPFTKDSESSDDVGISAYVTRDLQHTVYGYHLSIFRARDHRYAKFFKYLLDSTYAKTEFLIKTPGVTRIGLSRSTMRYLRVPTPPPSDVETIASYLDRETAEIDAFIAESERLIELLNERRTAAITQAVTKGLNPDAPMKDSGIEWLGEVPEHWEVRRLGTTVKSAQNGVWGAELGAPEATELRCVRVADFDRPALRIQDRNVTFRSFTPAELQGRVLQRGNLLLEKSGGGEKSPVGFTVLYDRDEPAVCSNFVARVVLRDEMESRFWTYVHHVLYRARLTERSIKQATGIQNLDQSSYFDEKVAVPNKHEQELIADHLDLISETISSSIDTAREGIALARERRQALISAAVTGKIDVRSAP